MRKNRVRNPDPVDIYVGTRLRMQRNLKGMSTAQLGAALNLTFQQIQKYEKGTNRMGASRLYQTAQILEVPVKFFFEDMPERFDDTLRPAPSREDDRLPAEKGASLRKPYNTLGERETLNLVRAYYGIESHVQRRKIYELIYSLSSSH